MTLSCTQVTWNKHFQSENSFKNNKTKLRSNIAQETMEVFLLLNIERGF